MGGGGFTVCSFYRECSHALSYFSGTDWLLCDRTVVEKNIILGVSRGGGYAFTTILSRYSVCWEGIYTPYGLGRLAWNALLMMKHYSLDWWFGIRSGRQKFFRSGTQCGEIKESIEHTFFQCPLYELIESYMVLMLQGQFFVLDAFHLCSNVSLLLNRRKPYVVLYLLAVMDGGMDNQDELSSRIINSLPIIWSFSSRSGCWGRDFLPRTLL